MFSGLSFFSSDPVWQQIVGELGATVTTDSVLCDVNLDKLDLKLPISPTDLKSAIIAEIDGAKIIDSIFGRRVSLSPTQTRIITLLYKSGGMSADGLKSALGYAPDATTHSVETLIYGLRKLYGYDFIKNINGIFKLGRI
ncbi:MAG: winged helix-turn-helix domain-containing protein [Alphaproteobacteria bacterium]|nr:winged helix-turn-helix domain-containing protein [Alphaproteobacteria bacterium]